MKHAPSFFAFIVVLLFAGALPAQNYAPPESQTPDEPKLKNIQAKANKLAERLAALRQQHIADPALVEAEIYEKAAVWITKHNEFFHKDAADWTLEALDRGLLRAGHLATGDAPWLHKTGAAVVRAYRSRVDGSVQPYAVTLPADYGKDARKKWRLDVVLHGRDASLTEVKFLHAHTGDKPAPARDYVQLDIYGRGNNAYRWAGDTDVFEAMDAFVAGERLLGREQLLDPNRVVLRGFSMGGAGTWQIGLHTPDRWCVVGPGAGFTTTHGYLKDLPEKLPPYQESCLRIYDAVDYAENAFNVPVVAYGGDRDPQLHAAQNVEAKLKPLGIPMTLLVAPGLAHQFPPEWQQKAEEQYAPFVARGRADYPKRLHFVTYTLKYNTCNWIEIIGLDKHYERAVVDAEHSEKGFTVKTENVRTLHLGLPLNSAERCVMLTIDGQEIECPCCHLPNATSNLYMERVGGRWQAFLPERLNTDRLRRPQKMPGLQGPIDDAFTNSFLCVRGTGTPWHPATKKYADASLERFAAEWNKYMRAELPIKDDVAVASEDIAGKHLILFGDPASNSLIGQVIDALPLQWTKEQITLGGRNYAAAEHVPCLIYPSPLNPRRYIVLNSGHTFHAADFQGTNALLYPRLGDYAILRPLGRTNDAAAADVVEAGLFDDFWQLKNRADH